MREDNLVTLHQTLTHNLYIIYSSQNKNIRALYPIDYSIMLSFYYFIVPNQIIVHLLETT